MDAITNGEGIRIGKATLMPKDVSSCIIKECHFRQVILPEILSREMTYLAGAGVFVSTTTSYCESSSSSIFC